MTPQAKGEYTVLHLRPKPDCIEQFMPLWNARNAAEAAGDAFTVARLTERMREYQYEVDEQETFSNLVTTVGKNDLLDKYLKGATYTQSIRMGLKSAGTAAIGDTQASHVGWLEVGLANAPTYTAPRKTVTMGSAVAAVSTSPVQAFAITGAGTVAGCFINNGGSATIDDTAGILFSAGDFSNGSKVVANLDTLNVTYTLTAT